MKPSVFFEKYSNSAIEAQNKLGIPASITLAQAALESAWGESELAKKSNNFFGIKDQSNDEWYGEFDTYKTREVINGQSVYINSNFRKYKNPTESFKDHASFLLKNKRYKSLFELNPTDYKSWAFGLKNAGYATGTNYAQTLIALIENHKLYNYDLLALKKKD